MIGIALASGFTGCDGNKDRLEYPKAEKSNVTDDYFGTVVADPYRWMEDDTTQAVADWVDAENKITQEYLSHIPFRD